MKTLLTIMTLTLSLSAQAADMAKKTVTVNEETFSAETEIAQLFNEVAQNPVNPIAKKIAALKKQYEEDDVGGRISEVEASDVWRLSFGRSGQYYGGTYLIAVWQGYKASGSQVAWAIAHTHFDMTNEGVAEIVIEKFVNKISVGEY